MSTKAKNTKPTTVESANTIASNINSPPTKKKSPAKKKPATTKKAATKKTAPKAAKSPKNAPSPRSAPRGPSSPKGAPKAKATLGATKRPAAKDAPRGRQGGRVGALDAAYEVLSKSAAPMTSRALIDAMAQRGLWSSPGGKTPHATLYAAMTREIADKGRLSRFAKAGRGLFTLAAKKEA